VVIEVHGEGGSEIEDSSRCGLISIIWISANAKRLKMWQEKAQPPGTEKVIFLLPDKN
jgi:hypothetical protein